jgi:hypothetical protein
MSRLAHRRKKIHTEKAGSATQVGFSRHGGIMWIEDGLLGLASPPASL